MEMNDYLERLEQKKKNGFRTNENLSPFLFDKAKYEKKAPAVKLNVVTDKNKFIPVQNHIISVETNKEIITAQKVHLYNEEFYKPFIRSEDSTIVKAKNIIEILKNHGENRSVAYAFTYAFLFVMDTVDGCIFDGIAKLKKCHKELYRHDIKKWLKSSEEASQWVIRFIRKYANETEDDIFINLDEYQDRFKKEVFILYNVMLRQSANRWFKHDYDLAIICTKLDMANILVEYWIKMSHNVSSAMPPPYNQISNDYDVYLHKICAGIRNFITSKSVLPNIHVDQLNDGEQNQFKAAFGNFVHIVTEMFNEKLYTKMSDDYKNNRTTNQEPDGGNETHRKGA